jgi:hypothetical protein
MSRTLLIGGLVVLVLVAAYAWMHMYKKQSSSVWLASAEDYACPSGTSAALTTSAGCALASASAARAACNADAKCLGYVKAGATTLKYENVTVPSTVTPPVYVLVGTTPTSCSSCSDSAYYMKPSSDSSSS